MKRVLVMIVALAGIGGLIALFMYHPQGGNTASTGGSVPLEATTPAPTPVSTGTGTTPNATPTATTLKDGTYTGESVDVSYGPVQVQAVISGGKITAVNVLQMPNDSDHAVQLASESRPILIQEALAAQSANVDTVSGATLDSEGFSQSLQSALSQAGA